MVEGLLVAEEDGLVADLQLPLARAGELEQPLPPVAVTLTTDRFVNRGPDRPVFSEKLRAEMVAALRAKGVELVEQVAKEQPELAKQIKVEGAGGEKGG